MKREVVGYYIRSGKITGKGRYLNRWAKPVWLDKDEPGKPCESEVARFDPDGHKGFRDDIAAKHSGRVVAIVRKAKVSTCAKCEDYLSTIVAICRLVDGGVHPIEEHVRLVVEARDIARADQQRAEESKAAAWEQVRGLQMLARQLQDQIEAVRKALG